MRFLMLGGGPAAIAAAKAIRGRDKKSEIIIATDEQSPPYLRPMLNDMLAGRMDVSGIADPQGEDLTEKRIEFRRGNRATAVDPAGRKVTFADGSAESYDKLLIATGGTLPVPPVWGKTPPGVLPINTLEDTLRIQERLSRGDRAVVYGPGFLAIVTSSALRKRGCDVTWFRPDMPRHGYPISGELEANILDSVQGTGVEIRDGIDIASVREAGGGVEAVPAGNGQAVPCKAIVLATEREPAIDFLAGSGIRTETGVQVDDRLRTSAPDVYAAGDCAEIRDPKSGQARINFGWRSAILQGKLAGLNMAGAGKTYAREESDYVWVLIGPALLDRIR